MIVLVCGGRDYCDEETVHRVLDNQHKRDSISVLIEGGARGADTLARRWAWKNNIPVCTFKADWKKYGPAAGPIRNAQMLAVGHQKGKPDLVIAFPGGRGTADMMTKARAAGIDIEEIS